MHTQFTLVNISNVLREPAGMVPEVSTEESHRHTVQASPDSRLFQIHLFVARLT